MCVECDTDVAGGARHSRDGDGDDEVRRDVYERRVDCECVAELDIESNAKRVLLIYPELGQPIA